jgi:hypothetical protein
MRLSKSDHFLNERAIFLEEGKMNAIPGSQDLLAIQSKTHPDIKQEITFGKLAFKTIVVHTVTYFIMGLLALVLLDYRTAFATPITREYMRPVDDAIVALGPALQFIRGILFAIAFYPLREILFRRKNGWLITWLVLVMLGILSTFAAAPGSFEGLLYTKMPVALQISGWAEIMIQALLLAAILFYWVNHPEKKWIAWVLGIIYVLVWIFGILGFLMA